MVRSLDARLVAGPAQTVVDACTPIGGWMPERKGTTVKRRVVGASNHLMLGL